MYDTRYLAHHGVKGMKWGVRRYKKKADKLGRKISNGSLNRVKGYAFEQVGWNKTAKRKYAKAEVQEKKWANQKAKYEEKAKAKTKADSLRKQMGEIEDKYTYGKNANKKLNDKLDRDYQRLEKEFEKYDRIADPKYYERSDRKHNQRMAKQQHKTDIKKAVEDYSKSFDEWNRNQEANDLLNIEVHNMYKGLGRNRTQRIINAARNKSPEAKAYSKKMDEWTNKQDIIDEYWRDVVQTKYKKTGRNRVSAVFNNIRYQPIWTK